MKSTRQRSLILLLLPMVLLGLATRTHAAIKTKDGKIAFVVFLGVNIEIFTMNPDGSNRVNVTNHPAGDQTPSWSPDGTQIAFCSDRTGNGDIYVMNADGTNVIQLTTSTATDASPQWSHDGSKIAFRRGTDVFVMNSDGSGVLQLTTAFGLDTNPQFSPDDTKIVFQSQRDGVNEIYLMNADGSNQTRLTEGQGHNMTPSFSPDGSRILLRRIINQGNQLILMNPDGSNQIEIPTSLTLTSDPVFAPSGGRIIYHGGGDIWSVSTEGTLLKQHSSAPEVEGQPNWQPIFPIDTIGVRRPSTSQFLLRNSNTAGSPNISLTFEEPGDLPVVGDWNADGKKDVGVFRNGQFLLRTRAGFLGRHETIKMVFGQSGDLPIAGDWDGDGFDTVGLFRPGAVGRFLLTNAHVPAQDGYITSHFSFNFGVNGDLPVAGDWDGDGVDTIGIFRPNAIGEFHLSNDFENSTDIFFNFGVAGDLPIAGNWTGLQHDSVGVFRPSTGTMFLANNFVNVADIFFLFGQLGDLPVAGDWNGQ
jgi:hypothetical protein